MPRRYGIGSVFQYRGKGPWWIQYSYDGNVRRESSRSQRKTDAVRLLQKRQSEAASGKLMPRRGVLVSEILDDAMEAFRDQSRSIEWAQIVDNHLRSFFGDLQASRVGTAQIKGYVSHRRTKGIANSTINRELARLRRAYNLALSAEPPKVQRVPTIRALREPPPRTGFFNFEEFSQLRQALPEEIRPVITFAYNTGCRLGEILSLRWDQVDLDGKVVRLEAGETKNDRARNLPLFGDVLSVLEFQKQVRDQNYAACPWVFFRLGKQIKSFRGAWETACRECGLWDDERDKPRFIFHDLRRTGVRNLVRAGVPDKVAMDISGHRSRAVFDRYYVVSDADLRDAMEKLDRYHKAEAAKLKPVKDGLTQ